MSHYKTNAPFTRFMQNLLLYYIPNNRDNIKQILLKVLYLLTLILLVIVSVLQISFFVKHSKEVKIINQSRDIYNLHFSSNYTVNNKTDDFIADMKYLNNDFKAWISIGNTEINYPVFQTKNNTYYRYHNSLKQNSNYGALYFDTKNIISKTESDKNLIIYGNNLNNGLMFGELERYRELSFYKSNTEIKLITPYKISNYKIFSVMILNSKLEDDNNHIFNIYKQSFYNESDFAAWHTEAMKRSLFDTGIDINSSDNFLTLVTSTNDFENARIVVIAREVRENEYHSTDTQNFKYNSEILYPQKWYDKRKIK